MKLKSLLFVVLALLLITGSATADDAKVDSDYLKSIWHELTPEERASYDALMTEQAAPAPKATGVAPILGPESGDTCTAPSAAIVALPYMDSGDTTAVNNDYDLDNGAANADCGTGEFTFDGTGAANDIAYSLQVDQDCTLQIDAAPTGGQDLALYLVENTCNALPDFVNDECIGLDDSGGTTVAEQITFDAVAGNVYFVIIDGFNAGGVGGYDLTVSETVTSTGCNLVPVELQSFSVN